MSYNGSGTFQINTTGQPVVTGTVISSSAFNALTADLATGLSTAITKDGQTATTARIPFAQGISSTLVTDSTSTSTGSIITAGGVGVAKALFVGTTANIAGTTNLAGLTASSAVATDASKNLVSVTNTGTGNNVLATSPAITTPTISSLSSAAATALTLQSAGTTAITVDTSQNVGIGTTSPSYKLNVVSTSSSGVSTGVFSNANNSLFIRNGGGTIVYLTSDSSVNNAWGMDSTSNYVAAYTSTGAEKMRIDSSGNMGIGTSSPSAKLDVSGAVKVSGTITSTSGNSTTVFTAASATTGYLLASLINGSGSTYIATSASTGGLGIVGGGAYASTFGSTTNTNIELITNNTVRQTISGAGAIRWNAYGAGALTTDSSGNVTAVSDERVKTNIRPFSRGAEALRGILPILHGYTKESLLDQSRDNYAGFSAQNVQQYIPEAVDKMANEMLTLSDRPIIAALVNAFHELDARIKALETK